jgi:hypothetical protein
MVKKGTIARAALGAVLILILLAIGVGYRQFDMNFGTDTSTPPAIGPASAVEQAHPSFLYGRIAVAAGATYEGRLRWGAHRAGKILSPIWAIGSINTASCGSRHWWAEKK